MNTTGRRASTRGRCSAPSPPPSTTYRAPTRATGRVRSATHRWHQEKLLLIVSEVSETQDALRNGDEENEAEEVADILIRTLDYAAWRGIHLDGEVRHKMERNRERPRLHGRAAF